MVDRQDIDALLIGSLYGELSSTEEARLTAHLESHPADRTALANLTRAREVVRESRILQLQFEPPQGISALLMQEAVRRAPKQRDEHSWFQRFMRSFIAHPAMAAAATLVLVIGIAGTVYIRQGDNFAKATKENAPAPMIAPASPTSDQAESRNADGVNGNQVAQGSADDFKVKLDDTTTATSEQAKPDRVIDGQTADSNERARELQDGRGSLAVSGKNKKTGASAPAKPNELAFSTDADKLAKESEAPADPAAVDRRSNNQPAVPKAEPPKVATKTTRAAPQKTPPRLDVTTPTQAPKDLGVASSRDEAASRKGDASGGAVTGVGGGAGAPAGPRPGSTASAPPAPPPPPPPATIAVEEKEKQEKASAELAWAKEEHAKVVAAVKANKCDVAANLAVKIANRAPGYYAANVADDRAIKTCAQYISQQREREAERVQRAKATQRRATDEAPAPAPSSTK